jgi:DASS family divalent anion:Na+ symporter
LATAVGAALWLTPVPAEVEADGWHLLAIFVATIVAIVARVLPMGAVAVVSLAVVVLSGTLPLDEALMGFANTTVWLIVAAFLLAGTFIRTGLGRRIAFVFMSLFGRRTIGLAYSLAGTDLVLAPVVPSHTARTGGVVFPVLQSLAHSAFGRAGTPEADRTAGYLSISACQTSAVIAGMFVTAMAANPLAVGFAAEHDVQISWGLWALAALLPGIASILVIPLITHVMHPPGVRDTPAAREMALAELAKMGPMSRDERILTAAFVGLLLLWSFGTRLGIEATAAVFGALGLLLLLGVLRWEHVAGEHEAWSALVWFAALVMMADELGDLGITGWFAGVVTAGIGDVDWRVGLLVVSLAYFYSHYFFASLTAHVSAMYAPFLLVTIALGAPPLAAALLLGYLSNLFAGLTHYASGTSAIFFGAGYVSLGSWWRIGALLSVVNIAIWLVLGGLWWRLLGLW